MSLFLESFRTRGSNGNEEKILGRGRRKRVNGEKGWWGLLIRLVEMLWFSLVFLVENAMRSLWLCDQKTAISGGDGVELWPRKLATARFRLEDMKLVKKAVPNAATNPYEVILGFKNASQTQKRHFSATRTASLFNCQKITAL
ncbi:O-acyltransferase WSD1-like [Pyrus ussuriensis x Pyrus communis]|uniref:O-acyltransferase WSD1-like n=1 Tax=Pyrus ussuriensis x Pyrus communis TaxID=2448454 RepID=A0A5N5F4J0_9ROSA|nr:O-acyltransferase WSD1-like [Pyrus ussuriensis x Pyrus communis]KAB2614287.1 O-acyltransferase WSD1-like [Pyrus ussuriensis x Pyrus communis]